MTQNQSPIAYHTVFLATSTEEKIRDLNIVAEHKRLPLRFFNLRELVGTLHNAIEDGGSAKENATKKLKGAKKKIQQCRDNPNAVKAFCEKRGIDYAPERIWFGTEDSGVIMPREIWDHIPAEVFSLLPESTAK